MHNMAHSTPTSRWLRDVGVRRWRQHQDGSRGGHPRFEPVPRGHLVPGAVLWVRAWYFDQDVYKIRPAIVCGVEGRLVSVRPCTTAPTRHWYGAVDLEDYGAAGLGRPTCIRPRVVTIDLLDIVGIAGCLSDDDAARVLCGHRPHPVIARAA
jgi:hypothetical protein